MAFFFSYCFYNSFSPITGSELVYDITAEVPVLWYLPGKVLDHFLVLKIIPGFPGKHCIGKYSS